MIELIFSLQLTSTELEKKYEYCYKPNRCQMVNAVVYNTFLIRNQIQLSKPDLPTGISCRVNIRLAPNGGITSIAALNCDPQYSGMMIKSIVAASPFQIIPEAFEHIKDINLTVGSGN